MNLKPTQIRITNTSPNEIDVDFNDIINEKLNQEGLYYEFEGKSDERPCNKLKLFNFIRFSSVDVIKSISKIKHPKINLEDFVSSRGNNKSRGLVDVKKSGYVKDIKLVITPKSYAVLTFFHE